MKKMGGRRASIGTPVAAMEAAVAVTGVRVPARRIMIDRVIVTGNPKE